MASGHSVSWSRNKCVFEAWSLIAFHPLGTNHQVSCSLFSLAELASSAQARNLCASNYSNVALVSFGGEGAPETLESASGHSSTLRVLRRGSAFRL